MNQLVEEDLKEGGWKVGYCNKKKGLVTENKTVGTVPFIRCRIVVDYDPLTVSRFIMNWKNRDKYDQLVSKT
jgi:hypothetical protein